MSSRLLFRSIPLLQHWKFKSSSVPELPECAYQPPNYKGIKFENARKVRAAHLNPTLSTLYKEPIMVTDGHMQFVWDSNGKRYLDMYGGIVTVSVGHCNPKVNQAAIDQINKLWHTTNIYMHPNIHEYAEKLAKKMPGNLKVCFFCNSGSEANDIAMVMARLYTRAFDIISFRNSYHGCSPYTMGLCGVGSWKFKFPNGFGITHAMNPNPYTGIWGGSNCRDSPVQTDRICDCINGFCEASERYSAQFQEVLDFSLPKKGIAGLVCESIQGVGGVVQYPKNYLQNVFRMVRDRGGICIADGVQTGFGRTGSHYWGFENHGVIPDIVTMAKGIGNGFPLAAVVTTPEIAKTLVEASFFNTFGGNPIACAVGSAVLDVLDEENCMKNCAKVGTRLLKELEKLRSEFEVVGDVRGKGFMIGVELVINKTTRKELPVADVNDIFESCKNMGLLIGKGGPLGNVFRIKPPMIVGEKEADFTVGVLRSALEEYSGKHCK